MQRRRFILFSLTILAFPGTVLSQVTDGNKYQVAPVNIMQNLGFSGQSNSNTTVYDNNPCSGTYVPPYYGNRYGFGYGGYGFGGYGCRNYGIGGYGYPVYVPTYPNSSDYDYSQGYQNGYSDGQYTTSIEYQNQILQSQLAALQQTKGPNGKAPPAAVANAPSPRVVDPNAVQRVKVTQQRIDTNMKAGQRLFEKGSFSAAADRFEQAAALSPTDSKALFYSAQAYISAEKYDKASAAITRGLAADPNWPSKPTDMRLLYSNKTEHLKVMGEIARRIKANPNDTDALFLLGFQLFSSGETEKARLIFEKLAKQSPGDARLQPFLRLFHQEGQGIPAPPPPGLNTEASPIPVPDLAEQPVQFAGDGAPVRQ